MAGTAPHPTPTVLRTGTLENVLCVFDPTDPDAEFILGPFEPHETLVDLRTVRDMETLWVMAGFFKSKTQARKNGHGGSIPSGFTDHFERKKRMARISIWNPTEDA